MFEEYYDFLLRLCDDMKENITALKVVRGMCGPDADHYNRTSERIDDRIHDQFFTGLMLMMGYEMPHNTYYSMVDYGYLCEVLDLDSDSCYTVRGKE